MDGGHGSADDSVGRSTCEAEGRVGRNSVPNVANGIGTSVGQSCVQDGGRWYANNSVGRSTSGRGLIGVRASVGTLVGRICRREWRRDAGNSVGRSASGHGSIDVGATVGMTEFAKRHCEQCQDLSWSDRRMQTMLGCWQPKVGRLESGRSSGWGFCGLIGGGALFGRWGVLVDHGVKRFYWR